jgi:hypothetical protein
MPTEVLVIGAMSLDHVQTHKSPNGCGFAAVANCGFSVDVLAAPGSATTALTGVAVPGTVAVAFVLPQTPRPLKLRIRAVPHSGAATRFWDVEGELEYRGNGLWFTTPRTSKQFSGLPQLLRVNGPGTASLLTILLSPLRDVTERALDILRTKTPPNSDAPDVWPPPNNADSKPWGQSPTAWDTPALADHHFIASTPIVGKDIQLDLKKSVDPDTFDIVLQIKGFVAPQLIAVSWPRERLPRPADGQKAPEVPLAKNAEVPLAAQAPFFIFFKPGHGQNFPDLFKNMDPPFGWDFVFFGLWRTLNYMGDPARNPFPKGIPYQADVSGKRPVMVVPQPNGFTADPTTAERELKDFMSAEKLQTTLEELHAFVSVASGAHFLRPNLGRVGMGAFSQGCAQQSVFLQKNEKHDFCVNILRELYVFDPTTGGNAENSGHAIRARAWALTGPTSDKRVCFYTQEECSGHGLLLKGVGGSTGIPEPYVQTAGSHTAAVLSTKAWGRALGLSKPVDDQEAHQLIPALMLTDALRRSGF